MKLSSSLGIAACVIAAISVGGILIGGVDVNKLGVSFNQVSQVSAENPQRTEVVDSITDWVFYSVNPKLNKRPLQSNESDYIREWNNIRKAIDRQVVTTEQACNGWDGEGWAWEFDPDRSFEASYNELADIIFHSRHLERQGRAIGKDEVAAMKEWQTIRSAVYISTCGV